MKIYWCFAVRWCSFLEREEFTYRAEVMLQLLGQNEPEAEVSIDKSNAMIQVEVVARLHRSNKRCCSPFRPP